MCACAAPDTAAASGRVTPEQINSAALTPPGPVAVPLTHNESPKEVGSVRALTVTIATLTVLLPTDKTFKSSVIPAFRPLGGALAVMSLPELSFKAKIAAELPVSDCGTNTAFGLSYETIAFLASLCKTLRKITALYSSVLYSVFFFYLLLT